MAFHQKVSVAMGMSLQHLADSLFVNMSNLILLRRDAYLDFVKQGVKPDTMKLLRNAPLFGYGLDPQCQDKVMSESQTLQSYQTLTSSVCTKTLNLQDVCCPAVFHAPSVHLRGPPQKKGVSPARYQSKIKHVKGYVV